jgi:hypothetical protein
MMARHHPEFGTDQKIHPEPVPTGEAAHRDQGGLCPLVV